MFYAILSNGWVAVITIPTNQLLHGDMDSVMYLLVGMSAVLLIGLAILIVYNMFKDRKNRYVNETLKILGNTYYAIYRINYENATYQAIKSNEDMADLITTKGHYEDLIKAIKLKVEEKTYEEFERSFSLQNIRSLIDKKVYEFGGDFQRKFDDGYHWVCQQL